VEDNGDSNLWKSIRDFFTSRDDNPIEDVIKEAEQDGDLGHDVGRILQNVLRLETRQIKEVMKPRPDIVCLEENAYIRDVAEKIIESGHSRLPIYRDNKDQIIAVIHAKDILPVLLKPDSSETAITELMRPPLLVPETISIKSMLLEFQSKKMHLAIALDEYGGTSGLITLEDVLEEIVGEIEDEYDPPKPREITVLEDECCLVSGRTMLDDLKEELDIELTSDFVETLGGFLIEMAGRIPAAGETFETQGYSFQIKEADAKQIHSVLVFPVPKCTRAESGE
jgi:magnesium and cobalt transporter